MQQYLTRREVSEHYPISYSNLAHMAVEGKGPPYARIGKKVIYKVLDVERWIDSHRATVLQRRRRQRKLSSG